MLENEYLNLYQSDFYKQQVASFNSSNDLDGLRNFEKRFSLANALYTESLNYIGFTSDDPKYANLIIVGSSETIKVILTKDSSILQMLKDAEEVEKNVRPARVMTFLNAAVLVCEKHMKQIEQNNSGKQM